MRADPPVVSIVIPVLNEERDVVGCLEAIDAQSYPRERTELLIVDGESDDRTVEVVERVLPSLGLHSTQIVSNPKRRTSTSLNVGLEHARGEFLVRLDARSRIEPHYVATVVEALISRPDVAVVGGGQVAVPRSPAAVDRGIARALGNRWATGFARYRRTTVSGPTDTVWMGAFRTDDLRRMGGWNAAVALNEDFDLNSRFRASGATVWYEGALQSEYLPRSDLLALGRQYFRFGRVKGTWWARGGRPNGRQTVALVLPVCLALATGVAGRRWGAGRVVGAMLAGAVLVEAGGARENRAPAQVRAVSLTAIGTLALAWWSGTVIGFIGERLGVQHQHA